MSKEIGNKAEEKAAKYLKKLGFVILERNFYSRFGEIDIIATKDSVMHFFEVKYSKNYDPIERITPSKLNKLIKTINFYMYNKNIDLNYQIDAVLVNENTIEILENISY